MANTQIIGNNAYSTLASPLTGVGTTVTIDGLTGSRFPTINNGGTGSDWGFATLQDSANRIEIVKITRHDTASDTFTVVRSQEGTNPGASMTWVAGDVFEMRLTAGTAVITDGAQTLTNKTLNSPTLVTPALGTPASGDLVNCTGLPVGGITGTLPVANGGTGRATLSAGKYLKGDGTNAVAEQTLPIPVTDGGTGVTTLATGELVTAAGTGAFTTTAIPTGGLVGVDATQTLTNKDLTGADLDTTSTTSDGTTKYPIGYRSIPQDVQSSTPYTLVAADNGKHVYSQNSGAQTIFIPADGATFPVGMAVTIVNNGTNSITIDATTNGNTMRWAGTASTGNRILAIYGMATLLKVSATLWFVSGVGLS